ncbi:MAG: lipopolysaccharide assembly protein LapA domain-containing protein [Actinomycetota bacterium]
MGDFRGLTASLNYLNDGDPATTTDLGVTGLWLTPIFASPSYHGYDVTDHRPANPDYGTMDDFWAVPATAHERGIAVLVCLVLNHTSDEHPRFEASTAGDPAYADRYLRRDQSPGCRGPWDRQVWHERDGRSCYALFWEKIPDPNLESPAVRDELYDVARFWLEDVGVGEFRVDAAKHFVEQGPVQEDTVASRRWMAGFTSPVHRVGPTAVVLGEGWGPRAVTARHVADAMDLVFDFDFSTGAAIGLQAGPDRRAGDGLRPQPGRRAAVRGRRGRGPDRNRGSGGRPTGHRRRGTRRLPAATGAAALCRSVPPPDREPTPGPQDSRPRGGRRSPRALQCWQGSEEGIVSDREMGMEPEADVTEATAEAPTPGSPDIESAPPEVPPEPKPEPTGPVIHRIFVGTGLFWGLVIGALLTVVIIILAAQNIQEVTVEFLPFEIRTPLIVVLLASLLVGVILDEIIGWAYRAHRRRTLTEREELRRLRATRQEDA